MFGFQMLGLVNFEKRRYYVLFIKQEKIYFFHSWARHGTPGPARAHRRCLSVGGCSYIWFEMLGLVHFDNRNCYTMVPNFPWCQIVRGAKLSMLPDCPWWQIVHFTLRCQIVGGAKLSVVPNCPQCQIVRCQIFLVHDCPIILPYLSAVKFRWCQILWF